MLKRQMTVRVDIALNLGLVEGRAGPVDHAFSDSARHSGPCIPPQGALGELGGSQATCQEVGWVALCGHVLPLRRLRGGVKLALRIQPRTFWLSVQKCTFRTSNSSGRTVAS